VAGQHQQKEQCGWEEEWSMTLGGGRHTIGRIGLTRGIIGLSLVRVSDNAQYGSIMGLNAYNLVL
jgi:hypothetical protein